MFGDEIPLYTNKNFQDSNKIINKNNILNKYGFTVKCISQTGSLFVF